MNNSEDLARVSLESVGFNTSVWSGKNPCLKKLHLYIRGRVKVPKRCTNCNLIKRLDLANISQEYKIDLDDWEFLCRKCHMTKDGRIVELIRKGYRRSSNRYLVNCKFCNKEFITTPGIVKQGRGKHCSPLCARSKNKTSRYKGICWHKQHKRWMAAYYIKGKKKYKYFHDEEEAYKYLTELNN